MRRRLFTLALMVSLAAAIAMIGCSDDKKDNNPVTGDVTDPSFVGIADINDGATELHFDHVVLSFGLTGYISESTSPRAIGASLTSGHGEREVRIYDVTETFNATSGWHVLTVDSAAVAITHFEGLSESTEVTYFKGIDSLRYTDTSGVYLSHNLYGTNVRKIESHSTFHVFGDSSPDIYDTASFTIEGNFMSTITLNGTAAGTVDQAATATDCGMTGHFSQTFTNIPLDAMLAWIVRDCPASGSTSLNISMTPDCPEGVEPDSTTPSGTWTVTMTFNNGQKYITASDGTTSWTDHDWCGANPTALTSADTTFVEDAIGGGQLGAFYFDIPVSEALIAALYARAGRDIVPPAATQMFDSIAVTSVAHSYTNQWHVFSFTIYLINMGVSQDSTRLDGVDSVKIYESGAVVELPTNPDSLTGLDIRLHATWDELFHENDGSGALHHRTNYVAVDVGAEKMAQGTGTLIDSTDYHPSDSIGHCNVLVTSNAQMTNLTFDPGMAACPVSGQLTASAMIDVLCYYTEDDHLNANGDWTVTAVANGDGTVTVTYSNGHSTWSVEENCN